MFGNLWKISCLIETDVEYCWKKIIFALPKVVRQQFVGEVGKFVTFWCQVFWGCCIPKIVKIDWFWRNFFTKKIGHFVRHMLACPIRKDFGFWATTSDHVREGLPQERHRTRPLDLIRSWWNRSDRRWRWKCRIGKWQTDYTPCPQET